MSSRRQEQLRALGRHIADEQDKLLAENERTLTAPTRPVQLPARRSAAPTRALLAAGAVALVASLGLVWLRTRPLEVAVTGRTGWSVGETVQTTGSPLTARFSDDSQLELAPAARARLLELTRAGAAVRLESGRARVRITPDRHGVWTLHAGHFAVHVTGTRFELHYDALHEQLSVHMYEGKVLVTGCALVAPEPLSAGESLRAACRAGAAEVSRDHAPELRAQDVPAQTSARASAQQVAAPNSGSDAPRAAPDARQTLAPGAAAIPTGKGAQRSTAQQTSSGQHTSGVSKHAEPPSPAGPLLPTPAGAQPAPADATASPATATGTPRSTWQELARAGKFEAAYALGRSVEHAALSVADLLLFGDTARLSNEASAALAAYAEVRRRSPGSDAAAVAAFASGRVQFDQRAAFPEAARWFQTYLRERAGGPLAREAHGRLVEALERAGEHASARRSAGDYLRAYPSGPHATFARTLLTAP